MSPKKLFEYGVFVGGVVATCIASAWAAKHPPRRRPLSSRTRLGRSGR